MADPPGAGLPPDQPARDRVRDALDRTLFVEAGAGSGKTTKLVDRVLSLVTSGTAPMREVAAITFTEAAASELRDRIRAELHRAVDAPALDDVERARCDAALSELDDAAIGTLHGFAHRVLSEHPLEAGLPPRVDVHDEITSRLAFDARWERFLDRILDAPALAPAVVRLLGCGGSLARLRDVATAFHDNWDRLDPFLSWSTELAPVDTSAIEEPVAEAIELADQWCTDDTDLMFGHLRHLQPWLDRLRRETDDDRRLAELRAQRLSFGNGRRASFGGGELGKERLGAIQDLLAAAQTRAKEVLAAAADAALRPITRELAHATLDAADERRRAGRLEFHDLLVLARDLLGRDADARQELHRRYSRLLLDEFQDTDPIQVELAMRIAAEAHHGADVHWSTIPVPPGRLFFVGDPKQSIYRFRRADISLFMEAAELVDPDDRVPLTANFRTVEPVLRFVNAVFEQLMGAGSPGQQPPFVPLDPVRTEAGSVTLFGGPASDLKADELREVEAADVAGAIRTVVGEGWEIGADGDRRPARFGDITVLIPARTSLPMLESALTESGIPYRTETGSLVYGTQEVRDLLNVLWAIDDPGDQVAVVGALRSPAFGCGDDDLLEWFQAGGRWSHRRRPPATVGDEHPVRQAMEALRSYHEERTWVEPSRMVERVLRERGFLETAVMADRPRDVWRRLRWVLDQARAFEEAEGGTLRDFLAWADLQSSDTARVTERVLPEGDDDAVRIMTIHGAKGLEFPVTILSGLSTLGARRRQGVEVLWDADGGPEVRLSSDVHTTDFELARPAEEQMDAFERLRLLYVAMTRARDHLLVSVHHKQVKSAGTASHAQRVHEVAATIDGWRPVDGFAAALALEPTPAVPIPDRPDRDAWLAGRDDALARRSRSPVMAATVVARVAAGDDEADPAPAEDATEPDDAPTWRRGRSGTAIGRAVHAVLQTVDLATGAGLDQIAVAQAAAEGVDRVAAQVAALARSALGAPCVAEAVAAEAARPGSVHREIYVGAPVAGAAVEGFVDLLYDGPDGLVVVDWKTDGVRTSDDLDAKAERYRLQAATYALAVEQVTGRSVTKAVLVFCRAPGGAVEREIRDLRGAVDEVAAVVAASF